MTTLTADIEGLQRMKKAILESAGFVYSIAHPDVVLYNLVDYKRTHYWRAILISHNGPAAGLSSYEVILSGCERSFYQSEALISLLHRVGTIVDEVMSQAGEGLRADVTEMPNLEGQIIRKEKPGTRGQCKQSCIPDDHLPSYEP